MRFLNSINQYRALAILMIVASHLYHISDIVFETFLEKFVHNLLAGSTLHFVFISGFLFYHVFYKSFDFRVFIGKRVKRVFIPYIILSIIPIAFWLYLEPWYWHSDSIRNLDTKDYLISIFKFVISGAHITAYWYIPFAVLLFLTAKIHLQFLSLRLFYQIIVLSVLCLVSIYIHRPHERIDFLQAIHSYFYFIPMYLFGMLCSRHKSIIYKKFYKKELLLLFLALFFAAMQGFLGYSGNYKVRLSELNGVVDLVFIQKIFLCLFFMVYLNRFENKKSPFGLIIASASFPIFFLHVYVLKLFDISKTNLGITIEYPWITFTVLIPLIVIFCLSITVVVEKLFPKYASLLIGSKTRSRL